MRESDSCWKPSHEELQLAREGRRCLEVGERAATLEHVEVRAGQSAQTEVGALDAGLRGASPPGETDGHREVGQQVRDVEGEVAGQVAQEGATGPRVAGALEPD